MFAELDVTSNFTFLTGASHPEEHVERAALLGIGAIAIADENSVAGIVRAHAQIEEIARTVREREAAEAAGPIGPPPPWVPPAIPDERYLGDAGRPAVAAFETRLRPAAPAPSLDVRCVPRLIPAVRLVTTDGLRVTALPRDRAAWGRLCRLITIGRRRAEKGACEISTPDLLDWAEGMELLLHPLGGDPAGTGAVPLPDAPLPQAATVPRGAGAWWPLARRLTRRFPGRVALLLAPRYDGQDRTRFDALARLARRLGVPTVASASPLMHHGARRKLADVLTAIRTGGRVDDLGRAALANAEQRLRSEAEMRRLFAGHEAAVDRAWEVARRCTFSLDELRYEYPSEISAGETPADRLRRLAHEGLVWRYPSGAPEKVRATLDHELALIARLGYEPYFLTVNDVVAFARSRDILCQGRGSAANSVVCYCLGVTSVSPEIGTMVFERFVSEARNEPPDIDVDFEHERREEVIQWIYERYGRHRAGICATVIHYRGKRAIREVGKAMGLTDDTIAALSSQLWGFFSAEGLEEQRLREIGLDSSDRRLRQTLELVHEIQGFPRHLSQHVGGFVITEGRLDELVPVENATMEDRTVICWDKDDIDALGILKVDVLALGMLTCIRKAFDLIARHHQTDYDLATIPPEDGRVYDMLCRADTVGVFQVESRAQMSFLPRMKPRCFYDLVIEVAIIRPGPIQGDMLHPYLRRRCGEEAVDFPSDELGAVLGKTLGVPLFQEQAMQIAIIGAGFSPEEADRLRRALATFKKVDKVTPLKGRFLSGMRERGYDMDFAERCFAQIEGFGSYGFPESHAASFALLVYASSWLKRHHPGIFACALLNSQPMGFYAPAQIVRDAREHGVEVRPVCINRSYWDCTMEPDGRGGLALRLGFRQIRAMRQEEANWIAAARGNGYRSVEDVWRRAGTSPRMLRVLSEADAFADIGLTRREALWDARAVTSEKPLPLFGGDMDGEGILEDPARLPRMTLGEEVVEDYVATRLTLRAHPMALLRHLLTPGTPPLEPPGDGDPSDAPDWTPVPREVRGPGAVMNPQARHPRDADPFRGRSFGDAHGITRDDWWDSAGGAKCVSRRS
ncbi:error-prone DNA polymerase [Roseitranquillus sediminis]|uniref:error-prone DNA polymerase n=1 Tax=Roseitranquillus sediminis TaxID=2809051 RepID=UPI001D0CAB54|nr:error-prone DNA polymerase [Roseitranquillus sediminis]MBM9596193.1 error-prone DNA polymerase [Roseitranquillus sediminis]